MTAKTSSSADDHPTIAQIRAARAALWAKGGGTSQGFSEAVASASPSAKAKPASREAASRRRRKSA